MAPPTINPTEILWWTPTASTLVLVRASGALEIHSLKDGALLRHTQLPDFDHDRGLFALNSTRDDATLACTLGHTLVFYPLATLQPVTVTDPAITNPDESLGLGSFGKAGKWFCTLSYDSGNVWALDPATGAIVEHGDTGDIENDAVFLSDDGETFLTIGHRQSLSAWHWPAHRAWTQHAADPNGRIERATADMPPNLIALLDGQTTLRIIDLPTGKTRWTVPLTQDQDFLAFSPDPQHPDVSRYVLSSPDHLDLRALTAAPSPAKPIAFPIAHPQECRFTADGAALLCLNALVSPDDRGRALTRSGDTLAIRDAATGNLLRELPLAPPLATRPSR
jgi:hypothetical protein